MPKASQRKETQKPTAAPKSILEALEKTARANHRNGPFLTVTRTKAGGSENQDVAARFLGSINMLQTLMGYAAISDVADMVGTSEKNAREMCSRLAEIGVVSYYPHGIPASVEIDESGLRFLATGGYSVSLG